MSAVTAVPIRPIARGSVLKLWIALVVLVAAGTGLAWIGTAPVQRITTPSGLQYRVLKAGTGPVATANDVLVLHYEGRLADGTLFDSSRTSGQPFVTPPVGLIPGFVEGLQLTQAGGRYRIWIPPNLGYGPGRVPPDSAFTDRDTLVFDVEVLRIVPNAAEIWQMQQMQRQMQQQQMQQQQMQGQPGAMPPGADPHGGTVPPEGER
ncbi:MAG: hypothetical protein QOD42_1330 [Sphingomonadales bacterium]|jgi:FKBP-type peptidyl-prolyl cis-trans isomerase FkpA|nr:hypothetical protein [Sphingomonadales bacterium]